MHPGERRAAFLPADTRTKPHWLPRLRPPWLGSLPVFLIQKSKHLCGERGCQSHYSHSCPRPTKLLCSHKAVSAPGTPRPVPQAEDSAGNHLLQKAALPLDSAGRAGAQHTAALTGRSPVCRASQPHQREGGGRGSDRVGRQGTEAGTQIRYRDLLCLIFFNCSREGDVTFREEKGKNLTNTTAQTHTELDTSPHVPTWS